MTAGVALLLLPLLASAGPLRLAASGTGAEEVAWVLDGEEVARSADGEAVTLNVSAGAHELWAVGPDGRDWVALARADPASTGGALFVPAWAARHEAEETGPPGLPAWSLPAALAAAGLLLAWPRRASKSP